MPAQWNCVSDRDLSEEIYRTAFPAPMTPKRPYFGLNAYVSRTFPAPQFTSVAVIYFPKITPAPVHLHICHLVSVHTYLPRQSSRALSTQVSLDGQWKSKENQE